MLTGIHHEYHLYNKKTAKNGGQSYQAPLMILKSNQIRADASRIYELEPFIDVSLSVIKNKPNQVNGRSKAQ